MLFELVGRMGPGIKQIVGFGDWSMGGGIFGPNVRSLWHGTAYSQITLCNLVIIIIIACGLMLRETASYT